MDSTQDLHSFLSEALEPDKYLRTGQKLITRLHRIRPELYDEILHGRLNEVFYDDNKLWELIEWLKQNW
jgi:hypothetical protein